MRYCTKICSISVWGAVPLNINQIQVSFTEECRPNWGPNHPTDDVNELKKKVLACELQIKKLIEYKESADRQQKQNEFLVKEMTDLTAKVMKFANKTKRLEEEKKREHREHKNQLAKMRKKVKTLTAASRSKDDSVIPVREIGPAL